MLGVSNFTYLNPFASSYYLNLSEPGVSCKSKLLLNSKIETYNLKDLENCKNQLTYNFSILQMQKQVQND